MYGVIEELMHVLNTFLDSFSEYVTANNSVSTRVKLFFLFLNTISDECWTNPVVIADYKIHCEVSTHVQYL